MLTKTWNVQVTLVVTLHVLSIERILVRNNLHLDVAVELTEFADCGQSSLVGSIFQIQMSDFLKPHFFSIHIPIHVKEHLINLFLFIFQDKFSRLLNILPEIHAMATRGEEHLYIKHCAGSAPTQTLLMEMLHAKRKV